MARSYILSFASSVERDEFLDWCASNIPELSTELYRSANRPDIIAKQITLSHLEQLSKAPHQFRVFEESYFGPAKED